MRRTTCCCGGWNLFGALCFLAFTRELVVAAGSETSLSADGLRALIIGGGPAGLTAALGLSKCCDEVIVVEQRDSFIMAGSNFKIAPNGAKALDELDESLMEKMRESAIEVRPKELMLPWSSMRDAILERGRLAPNIRIITGEAMRKFVDDPNTDQQGVTARFESGLEISCDFLVGADGVKSAVRACLGMNPTKETETTVFRGSCIVTSTASPELQNLLDKGTLPLGAKKRNNCFVMVTNFNSKTPGRLSWIFSTTREIDERTTPSNLVDLIEDDKGCLGLYKEMFKISDKKSAKGGRTRVVESLEVWGGRGRVTLVGDAAHAMRPTDGQGGNQAFEDAVILSRVFSQALKTIERKKSQRKNLIEKALRKFESTRLPRVQKIHDNQTTRYNMAMIGDKKFGPNPPRFTRWLERGV